MLVPAISQEIDLKNSGTEGVWSAGFTAKNKGQHQKISVTLNLFQYAGELVVKAAPWFDLYDTCSYGFSIRDNAVDKLVPIDTGGVKCPSAEKLTFARTGLNELEVTLPFKLVENIKLTATMRPKAIGEAGSVTKNLEILGGANRHVAI